MTEGASLQQQAAWAYGNLVFLLPCYYVSLLAIVARPFVCHCDRTFQSSLDNPSCGECLQEDLAVFLRRLVADEKLTFLGGVYKKR